MIVTKKTNITSIHAYKIVKATTKWHESCKKVSIYGRQAGGDLKIKLTQPNLVELAYILSLAKKYKFEPSLKIKLRFGNSNFSFKI